MHRRHQHFNIPIEIVRTVVAISETGSLSKAGERLGLSQPAISSQIKRLQSLVGGSAIPEDGEWNDDHGIGQARPPPGAKNPGGQRSAVATWWQYRRSSAAQAWTEHLVRAGVHQAPDRGDARRYLRSHRPFGSDRKGTDRRVH